LAIEIAWQSGFEEKKYRGHLSDGRTRGAMQNAFYKKLLL